MDKKLINRRSFFKKAASAALPIIAAITVPSLLTSCEIDEPLLEGGGSSGCSSCGSGCKNTCKGLCTRTCASTCKGQSYNTAGCSGSSCKGHCYASCKGTCSSSSK